ncbi:MAG: non-ribosomal peptide synthetase [Ktedonobacteraceae bacterium]
MRDWNTTQQDYPQDVCIHQRIACQAAATPNAVALRSGNETLSYRELNQRANQLAHSLQTFGVGPDTLVALCVERSLAMVVGLLGILKAGGAYVPLDPSSPPERLTYMLKDAQAPVLVTLHNQLPYFSEHSVHIICLDVDADTLAQQSTADPISTVTTSDLAYVIYTSGSTGQPKGVQITHSNLLNLVHWHQHAFAVTSADRATQVASPAFDATGWELWPYLSLGASVSLPNEETRVTPTLLRDWLVEQQITITFLPTPLAESIISLGWPATLALRFLLTGADTLRRYPLASLPFALINNYGPTEATVVATSGLVPSLAYAQEPPALGLPITNTHIVILDEQLQEVPVGIPGELYIGGAGLARGYHNRPELTAQRFITSPFDPSTRLYKTGDLARWLPDGQIAFLGRADHQIKLRGYRIEPGEIVAALNQQPAILASLVIAREDLPGEKRLVAYIVLVPGAEVTAKSLRESLASSLPDYMLPALFVSLPALPVMPNGKIDRAALPAPDAANTLREGALAQPNTPTEARLVEIMAPLLGLEQLGVDENFFMLGGHSLLGAQIIMRVTATFSVNLTLLTLFEAPTIQELSAEIEQLVLAKLETLSEDEIQLLLAEQPQDRVLTRLEEPV